ncbi:MAG: hypothetical protein AABY83_00100 [Pseudomonadota bacterium]
MKGLKLLTTILAVTTFTVALDGFCADPVLMATPEDNDDWTGDHIQILGTLSNLAEVSNPGNVNKTAPAFIRLDVSSDDGTNLILTPRDQFITENTNGNMTIKIDPSKTHRIYNTLNFSQPFGKVDVKVPVNDLVKVYFPYKVSKKALQDGPFVKYGWSYGGLLVPFKYQIGPKEISTSNSIQTYIQYKRQSNGLAEGPFISGGISTADVPKAAGNPDGKLGIAIGAGWIFEIIKGGGFQWAIMVGQDRFGKSSGYTFEGETWIAFSLGYKASNQTKSKVESGPVKAQI